MYGDSSQIKRRTAQLRDQGAELRALADRLVARTEAVGWRGRAADALHDRIGERAATLRDLAGHHEGAADALATHRELVDDAKERIAAARERAGALVEAARERVTAIDRANAERGSGPQVEPDPDDLELLAFQPPATGHRDWLTVELPGL